jgi:hypothetical protein
MLEFHVSCNALVGSERGFIGAFLSLDSEVREFSRV